MSANPSWLNAAPAEPVEVPPSVRALVGADRAMAVWRNQLGGLTWSIDHDGVPCFLKWAPAGSGIDLAGEAERMRWAAPFTPVPRVVTLDGDDTGTWLVTRALPGTSAVAPRWVDDPRRAVKAIGLGFRRFHDALPVGPCPYRADAAGRLDRAHRRLEHAAEGPADQRPPATTTDPPSHPKAGASAALDRAQLPREVADLDLPDLMALLDEAPPVDPSDVVVAHGDACAPNTIVDDAGRWVGHVDLGALGVDDRWADLAIVTWSLDWNYGPGWEPTFYEAYGIDPDPARVTAYRLLWVLT